MGQEVITCGICGLCNFLCALSLLCHLAGSQSGSRLGGWLAPSKTKNSSFSLSRSLPIRWFCFILDFDCFCVHGHGHAC